MAAPDDTTSRSPSRVPKPSDAPPEGSDDERPLRQRIADRWNSLGPFGKAGVVVGGLAAAAVGGFLVLSNTRATAAAEVEDEEETDRVVRSWTNHAGGYFVCSHLGCQKKVDPTVFSHDCCGRCRAGRDCLGASHDDYDGPGGFAHTYFEGLMRPGVCVICGEPPKAHQWVFDHLRGDRRPASWCDRCREDHPEGQHVEPDAS